VLAPSTLAMGATVPVFQLLTRSTGARVSHLYACNTAGAAVGVLLVSFVVLPRLGVTRTVLSIACLNAGVFLVSRLAPSREARLSAPRDPPAPISRPRLDPNVARLAVGCTGFATFALEVAWFRALRSAFWSTSSSFAIMLAAVLIPLALGASAVPWLRRRGVGPGTLLAAAAVAILLATPLIERMDLLAKATGSHPFAPAIWLLACLTAIGPAVALLATLLPWCLEEFRAPGDTGHLYAWNTLGAVAGSLLAAWVLLPAFGFAAACWLLGGIVGMLALALCQPERRLVAFGGLCVGLITAAAYPSSPGLQRPYGSLRWKDQRLVAHIEGADSTFSVVERGDGIRFLMIDGFNATTGDRVGGHYMAWMGSLPALLHPAPERGLVICFGSGETANALRREGIGALDVVDVSASVFALSSFFGVNEGVLQDQRVQAIAMDGRAWLRRTRERYDVITLEPMPPNFSGVNSLYSLEFYEIAARRLEPGGVVAQWLPTHLVTPDHAASIVRTFLEAFPDTALWYDPVGGTSILLGRGPGSETPIASRWPGLERSPMHRSLSDAEVRRALYLDRDALARFSESGSIVTDDNQLLQYSQLRSGLGGARSQQAGQANLLALERAAGRPPFRRGLRPAW
jgi:spermidine synthase